MKKLLATRWSGKEVIKAVTSRLEKEATKKILMTTWLGVRVKKKVSVTKCSGKKATKNLLTTWLGKEMLRCILVTKGLGKEAIKKFYHPLCQFAWVKFSGLMKLVE